MSHFQRCAVKRGLRIRLPAKRLQHVPLKTRKLDPLNGTDGRLNLYDLYALSHLSHLPNLDQYNRLEFGRDYSEKSSRAQQAENRGADNPAPPLCQHLP